MFKRINKLYLKKEFSPGYPLEFHPRLPFLKLLSLLWLYLMDTARPPIPKHLGKCSRVSSRPGINRPPRGLIQAVPSWTWTKQQTLPALIRLSPPKPNPLHHTHAVLMGDTGHQATVLSLDFNLKIEGLQVCSSVVDPLCIHTKPWSSPLDTEKRNKPQYRWVV